MDRQMSHEKDIFHRLAQKMCAKINPEKIQNKIHELKRIASPKVSLLEDFFMHYTMVNMICLKVFMNNFDNPIFYSFMQGEPEVPLHLQIQVDKLKF